MSNMSYCRFENTLKDLRDCNEHLFDDLSEEESKARDELVKLCDDIARDSLDDLDYDNDLDK
jgi:hypothetical protein